MKPNLKTGAIASGGMMLSLVTALAAIPSLSHAETSPAISAPAAPVHSTRVEPSLLEQGNFDLILRLDSDGVRPALIRSDVWKRVNDQRRARMARDVVACAQDGPCRVRAIRWTTEEVAASTAALTTALGDARRLGSLATHMRASGFYARHATSNDAELVSQAWRDVVDAQNLILDRYGLGQAPTYPLIDSISFEAGSDLWSKLLVEATNLIAADENRGQAMLRNDPAYQLALRLLYLNERENAGFFGDLDTVRNAPARGAIARTDWTAFPYSLILILGDGPDRPQQRIGSFGKLRLAHAVQLYRAGKAPLLVVSGGNVHPALTPLNEAEEMKRELVERYAIPESAIIMEPHARHTTTNFRNTARLMICYAIPLDKPALATTSEGHSLYAAGADFDTKAQAEISFVPRRVGRRLSPYDFEFFADPRSTHRDAKDPLDP